MNRPPSKSKPRKAPRRLAAIAPQPTLQGLAGAVGIDVAKAKFDVCFLASSADRPRTGSFPSGQDGVAKFLLWLKRVGQGKSLHLCLEETGSYGQALAAFLHQAGHQVSVVNAALIKSFGKSHNIRTKTDPVDARIIALYTLERTPPLWRPLAPEHQALRDAVRRREQVMSLLVQEKNHREACSSDAMRQEIERSIAALQAQIAELWKKIGAMVQRDELLRHQAELLKSIPGIGEISAYLLLAELPPLDLFGSARQLCAYAGLSPRQHESGAQKGRSRLCKQGRAGLRRLLFLPAVSLMRSKSGPLRVFADRLLSKAKQPKCVVGALMRKLMALVFAILRSGEPFDPNYRRPSKAA